MKKVIGLLCFASIVSGCSNLQHQSTPTTTLDHLATAGSLNCKSNEICPTVVVAWDKQTKEQLKIDVSLTSTYDYYDIKSISFSVDGKSFNYDAMTKTEQKYINRLIPRRSSNSFILPSSFLNELRSAQNIVLSISTDKGVIKRSVYTPTQHSPLYQNFVNLIASLPQK